MSLNKAVLKVKENFINSQEIVDEDELNLMKDYNFKPKPDPEQTKIVFVFSPETCTCLENGIALPYGVLSCYKKRFDKMESRTNSQENDKNYWKQM